MVTYTVTASDNCPLFAQVATPVQFPQSVLPHGGGAITVAGNTLPGGFYFDLTNSSATAMRLDGFGVRFGSSAFGAVSSPQNVSAYYTTSATTYVGNTNNAAAWTSLGTASVVVAGPNSEFSKVNLPN